MMDILHFESVMQRYFEKAFVAILKANRDYSYSDNTPTYILVDKKRATYYISESDIYADDDNINETIKIYSENLSAYNLSNTLAYAIGRLCYSFNNLPDDFKTNEVDLTVLTRKSALIISEPLKDEVSTFLDSRTISYQSVEFKGGFYLIFLDMSNSEKLLSLCEPSESAVTDSSEQRRVITNESITDINDIDVDNINNLTDNQSNGAGSDISAQAYTEFSAEDDVFNQQTVNSEAETEIKTTEPIIAAEDVKRLEEQELDLSKYSNGSFGNDKGKKRKRYPISNLLALIFMLPAYLLNKITMSEFPAFLIYWFALLAVFFGLYEIPASYIIEPYYGIVTEYINKNIIMMTDISAIIVATISFTQSIELKTAAELISNPIISSVGFVASVSVFLSEYELAEVIGNVLILKYALSLSLFLMLSPITRIFGLRLYSTFILTFITIPFILLGQSILLSMLAENIGYLIENPMANPPSGLFMVQSLFAMLTVFIIPLLIFLIYFTFFGLLIRDNNRRGVLP